MTPFQVNKNHVLNLDAIEDIYDTGEKRIIRMSSGHEYKVDEPFDQLVADLGTAPAVAADKKPAAFLSWIWGG